MLHVHLRPSVPSCFPCAACVLGSRLNLPVPFRITVCLPVWADNWFSPSLAFDSEFAFASNKLE